MPIEKHDDQLPELVAPAVVDVADPLDLLRTLRRRREQVDAQIALAVAARRRDGLSWHQIGLAFGLTAEGARRRWGGIAVVDRAAAEGGGAA